MKPLTRADLKALAACDSYPTVSVYMPLHRSGPDNAQDPIRLKNLLRQAHEQLVSLGTREAEIDGLLKPLWELLVNQRFWVDHSGEGLALFAASNLRSHYRVPCTYRELVEVANGCHVKPLVPLLLDDGQFFLLTVSKHAVRLYRGTRMGMTPVELPDTMPWSMEEALAGVEVEQSLQHHSVNTGGRYGVSGMVHGQGRPKDIEKKALEGYFRRIARVLEDSLKDEPRPLVLAAVDYYHPIFQAIYRSPGLLQDGVIGSPDAMSEQELLERAWTIANAHFRQELHQAAERYAALAGTERTSRDPRAACEAAHEGRVDTIWAAEDIHIWGTYDPVDQQFTPQTERQPGDVDLANLAVTQTLRHGGSAYSVPRQQLPGDADGGPVAAVFRW
jgi:hypothetical protein